MFCMNCGTQLPDDAKFCLKCGKQMGAIAQPAPAPKVSAEALFYEGTNLRNAGQFAKASECFIKAAEHGHVIAQYNMGDHFYHGWGVSQDYAKSAEWYRKAAEKGNNMAQTMLAYCYENGQGVSQNYTKAVEWYGKAAAQGDRGAQKEIDRLKSEGKI